MQTYSIPFKKHLSINVFNHKLLSAIPCNNIIACLYISGVSKTVIRIDAKFAAL